MSSIPSAESTPESLAAKWHAVQTLIARRWLEEFVTRDQLQDMASARAVRVSVDDGLPQIVVDSGRAELVMVNLMANAIEYCDPERTDRYVRISQTPKSGLSIVVEANGVGISQSNVVAIFEQFVRECMEAMRGTVTLTSEEGKGAELTLIWPSPDASPA